MEPLEAGFCDKTRLYRSPRPQQKRAHRVGRCCYEKRGPRGSSMNRSQLKKARLDRDGNDNGTIIHHDSEQIASDRNSMIESLKTIADSIKSDK